MTTTNPSTTRFEVIVSNVGVVCRTDVESEARASYVEQKGFSESVHGIAAGEDVTLMMDGEPVEEFIGLLAAERAADEQAPCQCPACTLAAILAKIRTARAMANTLVERTGAHSTVSPTDADGCQYRAFATAAEVEAYCAGAIEYLAFNDGRDYKGINVVTLKEGYSIEDTATGAQFFYVCRGENEFRVYAQP